MRLYGEWQTDDFHSAPGSAVEGGVVPRNNYGNVEGLSNARCTCGIHASEAQRLARVLGSDGPPRGGALEVPAHLGYGGAAGHRRPPRGGGLRVQRRPQLPADGRGGGGGGALCQTGRMMNSRG
eukprot:587964-Prorocentrum_minimum.AAC.4